jgi:ubiquinone biosynthesis monooxygenase Coq7
MRKLSFSDRLLDELQHGLNTSHLRPAMGARGYPAKDIADDTLDAMDIAHSAGLMRVNNAGEVAAQGLYRGQALGARCSALGAAMQQAAEEENEHLNWCQQRLAELNQRRSRFDGIWYWGSFGIGALAAAAGDKWSLGFVKETEQQVGAHLQRHLQQLPPADQRSRAILGSMCADELRHAENAAKAGAAELPAAVKAAMTLVSKVMTFTAYRI